MDYNSISISPLIKSHLELQREITLIELAHRPYFICTCIYEHVCKVDEIPAMTLQDIKETKRYGWTHGRMDKVKTVYPPQTKFAGV